MINLRLPVAFEPLFYEARYKNFRGGRGSGKSWSAARALIAKTYTKKLRVLCTREFQSSIADSVHRVLTDQIGEMGLSPYFTATKTGIYSSVGSEFIFNRFHHTVQDIKSLEGIDICWCEEAHSMSAESWLILDPTIRKEGSEIWTTYNPDQIDDPTYQRDVVAPLPDTISVKVGYEDNTFFPEVLDKQRRYMLETDPDAYAWVWGGECRSQSKASIFAGRYSVHAFTAPEGARFYFGADWGFANDPTVLMRLYIVDDELYVDYEAVGYGVELEDLPALFAGGVSIDQKNAWDGIPGARDWPIKADSARPETISYVRRKGFNIDAAEKWQGCVEDGIAHLKGFRHIHIHERCKNLAQEARLYSYKVDRITGDILPKIVDKHNHGWDAARYSLDGYITSRGGLAIWEKLAG